MAPVRASRAVHASPASNASQSTLKAHAALAKMKTRAALVTVASKESKGTVMLISGCTDVQESADVSDTANFGLKRPEGVEAAGGACTSALLSSTGYWNVTWGKILSKMRSNLSWKGYKQVPMLSSNVKASLHDTFTLTNPDRIRKNGKCRALLIGINYTRTAAELDGCHNDVKMMKAFITQHGYKEGTDMKILMDHAGCERPTRSNIEAAMRWLVKGARDGDSLFWHYSGHGTQVPDYNGDEDDGYDEALCPEDYQRSGMLIDDDIHDILVKPLPAGVHLTCVTDCCHSGTMMDLPYTTAADGSWWDPVKDGALEMNASWVAKEQKKADKRLGCLSFMCGQTTPGQGEKYGSAGGAKKPSNTPVDCVTAAYRAYCGSQQTQMLLRVYIAAIAGLIAFRML